MPVEASSLAADITTIASPGLWTITVAVLLFLLVLDFVLTRHPHKVRMREAVGWSAFYLMLPLVFGVYLWGVHLEFKESSQHCCSGPSLDDR